MDALTLNDAVEARRSQTRETFAYRLRPALAADIDRFQELQAIRLGRKVTRSEALEWLLSVSLVLDHVTGILACAHGMADTGCAGGLHAAMREFARTMPGTEPARYLHQLAQTVSDHGATAAADVACTYDALGYEQAQCYQASGVTDAETFANSESKEGQV